MYKKLCSLFVAFVVAGNSYAQNMETYRLNKIVPMAPEGAKFANYFFTPSVSATGIIPVDIPLYELNVDGVKIPITLSYQTSGVKVTELSGSVGLGWSLNVGGGIYRSINGQPDEYSDNSTTVSTFLNPLLSMSDYMANFVDQTTVENQAVLASISSNGDDINQDNYSYNFLNRTGGLFFNNQLEIKELSDNKLRFSYDSKYLNYFLAKDDQGNNYKFGIKENSRNSYYSTNASTSFNGSVYGATAWKLSEITTVHNKKINFSYADYATSYNYPSSNSIYHISGFEDEVLSGSYCFSTKTVTSTSISNIQNTNKLITGVSSQDFKILFSYSDNPNASNWKRKLDKIEVWNQKAELVKVIRFEYSLFNGDPRLKLSRLIFDKTDGTEESIYSFLYHEESNMPQVGSMGKDAFGFYNGYDNNTTLLKTGNTSQIVQIAQIASVYWNSHREVEENFTKVGSLKQITYPTSGGIKLYYGANRSGSNYAPGLRVDKLEFFDSGGLVVNTKFYEYHDLEGLRITFPDYANMNNPVNTSYFSSLRCFSYSSENTMQQSHLPGNFFYRKVTIKEIGSGQESTTVEYYDEPNLYQTDEPLEGYIFQPILTNREFYKGNHINGSIVKSEDFEYNQITSETDFANIFELLSPYYTNIYLSQNGSYLMRGCFNFNPGLIVKKVLRAKILRLESQRETYFFDNDSSVFSKTYYHYDNPNHTYATRIVNANSNGTTTVKKIKYPQDMVQSSNDPLGIYQLMCTLNIISPPINSTTEVQGDTSGVMNEYSHSAYGFPVLSAVKFLNVLSKQYEGRIRYVYNKNGQVLEEQNENGPKICYLWGYSEQYPIAKIENATYEEVKSILTEATIDALNIPNVSESTILSTIGTLRNHAIMRKAQVTTYTYKPLVGLTSMTDAKGMTTSYEYDGFGRLKQIKDKDGNIVKRFDYHYKP